jgi:hypothetical protein
MADANGQVTTLSERDIFKLFLKEGHAPDDAAQMTREFAAVRAAKLGEGGRDPVAPSPEQITGQIKAAGLNGEKLREIRDLVIPARGGMVELKPTADANASKMQGAVSGVTFGFDDEIWGLTKAMMGAVGQRGISDVIAGKKSFWDTYRGARDARREVKGIAEEANPLEFKVAEVLGSLPPALLTGPVDKLRQAVVAGMKFGGAIGAGGSTADLTKGEVGGFAADTAIGAGVGGLIAPAVVGATELVGETARGGARLVANTARRLTNRPVATPVQHVASDMAKRVAVNADEPSLIGRGETIRSATQKATPIMQDASDAIGKPFYLRQSQATGDAEAALNESRAFNVPSTEAGRRTLQRAQAAAREQLHNVTQVAYVYHRRLAANPELIGKGGVGDSFGKVVDKQVDAMIAARSAATKDGYAEVDKAVGGVDYAPIRAKIVELMERMGLQTNQMTGILRKVLDMGDKTGAGGGLSIVEANSIRRMMMDTMRGKASPFGDRALNVQGNSARELIATVDDVFTAAESTSSGGAIQTLRAMNKLWADHSRGIESAVTDAVESITGKAGGELGETIGARMLKMQPRQIEGLFALAEKGDPTGAVSANMRSEMFYESLRAGSMPAAEVAAGGKAVIRPGTALDRLLADKPALSAAFKGQPKARLELARMEDLLERVSFTPNIRGSSTVPWLADMIRGQGESLAAAGGEAVAGRAGGAMMRALSSIVSGIRNNPELAVKAVSTPEGITAFNNTLKTLLKSNGRITEDMARAAIEGLRRAGINGGTGATTQAAGELRSSVFGGEHDDQPASPDYTNQPIAGVSQ